MESLKQARLPSPHSYYSFNHDPSHPALLTLPFSPCPSHLALLTLPFSPCAGKAFAMNLFDGARGLVAKPIQGAEKGFGGFIEGVGKGLLGAVAAPVTGTLVAFSKVKEPSSREKLAEEKSKRVL